MGSPYKLFDTDKNLESGAGVTLQYPGFSITIHRAGGSNKKYETVAAAKMKPHRFKMQNGLMDNDLAEQLLKEIYAESVVIGWNMDGKDGNPLPFTPENVVQVFTDLPDLFKDVQEQASNIALFRKAIEEIEEKN